MALAAATLAASLVVLRREPRPQGADESSDEGSSPTPGAQARAGKRGRERAQPRLRKLPHASKKNVTVWATADTGAMAPGGTGDAVPFASPASSLDLSEEELTVLREHPLEDLGRLTAQAQHDFVTAPSQDKDARHAYYRMLLNLGAKVLVDDGPEPTAETIERQRQYRERAQAEARRLASLPPAQREALLAAFKEDFFRDQRVPAAQEGRKP